MIADEKRLKRSSDVRPRETGGRRVECALQHERRLLSLRSVPKGKQLPVSTMGSMRVTTHCGPDMPQTPAMWPWAFVQGDNSQQKLQMYAHHSSRGSTDVPRPAGEQPKRVTGYRTLLRWLLPDSWHHRLPCVCLCYVSHLVPLLPTKLWLLQRHWDDDPYKCSCKHEHQSATANICINKWTQGTKPSTGCFTIVTLAFIKYFWYVLYLNNLFMYLNSFFRTSRKIGQKSHFYSVCI